MSWLEDVHAIEQVLLRYFDRVDALDPEGAAALFSADARIEIMTGREIVGRDAYARLLRAVLEQYVRTTHAVSNMRVTVDGDRAEMLAYVDAVHRMPEGHIWQLWARVVEVLRRDPDAEGGWVIVEHTLHGVDAEPAWERVPPEWFRGHPGRAG